MFALIEGVEFRTGCARRNSFLLPKKRPGTCGGRESRKEQGTVDSP
jgi:hypothetical protein